MSDGDNINDQSLSCWCIRKWLWDDIVACGAAVGVAPRPNFCGNPDRYGLVWPAGSTTPVRDVMSAALVRYGRRPAALIPS